MFATKRAIVNLGNCIIVDANPRWFYQPLTKFVPCFSSLTDQGPTTPGKLSRKDGTVPERSQGGYGGSGITDTTNQAVETSQGGGPAAAGNKETITTQPRRRNDADDAARDTADMAKAAAVGAMETGLKFGEMAKKTMDGMWDAVKKTTEDVRDTVADEDGDANNIGKRKQTPGGPRGYNY